MLHATKAGKAVAPERAGAEVTAWNLRAADNSRGANAVAAVKIARAFLKTLPSDLPFSPAQATKYFQVQGGSAEGGSAVARQQPPSPPTHPPPRTRPLPHPATPCARDGGILVSATARRLLRLAMRRWPSTPRGSPMRTTAWPSSSYRR